MAASTTLFGPFKQILTMADIPSSGPLKDEKLEIINDGGIRVTGGTIVEIGPYHTIKKENDLLHTVTAPSIALPGYIDAHTHICWAGTRAKDYALRLDGFTYQQIATRGGGILDTVRKTRAAIKEDLVKSMLARLSLLLKRGVTTCEVKSGYGLSWEDEIKILESIAEASQLQAVDLVPTCLAAHVRPPEFESNTSYLNSIVSDLLPLIRKRKLSNRVDIFVEQGAFTVEEGRDYLLKAKKLGFTLCVHADQFSCGGSALAAETGAISADHLEVTGLEELRLLKRAGTIPIVLPGACIGLGIPFPPVRKFLEENLPLVIASDWNPGSAPNGDLVMQAAILGAAEKLTMAETLRAITSNAARALHLHDRGILKEGMRADFLIYSTESYQEILYYQGAMLPSEIIIEGKQK